MKLEDSIKLKKENGGNAGFWKKGAALCPEGISNEACDTFQVALN